MEAIAPPLHRCHVNVSTTIVNRSQMLLHFVALIALFYYRATFLYQETIGGHPILLWLMVFASELMLSFLWILNQAFRWRPVSRTVFPEHLPKDENLPSIDVFICTADPDREPVMAVMNTVLSAMGLDYPPEKLSVYLSDDSGSPSTLHAMKATLDFAKWWLPFCRTYGIKTICPDAYFSAHDDDLGDLRGSGFVAERLKLKGEYDLLKESIQNAGTITTSINATRDHPAVIEVHDGSNGEGAARMPLLVYVAREKRVTRPHNFKAGALNALLRVSGVISNSPYILVLDCDMNCTDPGSAKQAMCFHLDPKISNSLAFVQFPQRFHNVGKNDIYDSQLRSYFTTLEGVDGLLGPILSGTCFYMKRTALYGPPNEFIKILAQGYKRHSNALIEEAHLLASCSYEDHTKWGKEVGFMYFTVVEDVFTGFMLHCKGWTSVYYNPSRPQFLGSATTNLNDVLIQQTKWYPGLLGFGISRFCPLIYGPMKTSVLQSMCYAELALFPLSCLPFWCFATIPQLCLLHGISLFPRVSSPFFIVYTFIFISSLLKHLHEVIYAGGSIQTWTNEQRMWMIKSVTSYSYGTLDALLNKLGVKDANFLPTNKVTNDQQVKLYERGTFDFQTSTMFLVPLVFLVMLNAVSLAIGGARLILFGEWDTLLIQVWISVYGLVMSYPIVEGMVMRKHIGCIPAKALLSSSVLLLVCFLFFGAILSMLA